MVGTGAMAARPRERGLSGLDAILMAVVCLIWGTNNIVAKLALTKLGAPPLFYTAVRFLLVAAATAPWLWPPPDKIWRLVVLGLLMGAGNFALLLIGLKTASPSETAIVGQLSAPLTILLSVLFLRERLTWRRAIGAALTLTGAWIVMWNPRGFSVSIGLIFVAASALSGASGAVMMKAMPGARPLQFQAWVAVSSFFFLAILSALTEHGQAAVLAHAFWPFLAATAFSGLVVSVLAHTTYYGLIQRHDAGLIQPLTLMTPIVTIFLGVLLTHDRFDARMATGALVVLLGLLLVVLRPGLWLTRLPAPRAGAPSP